MREANSSLYQRHAQSSWRYCKMLAACKIQKRQAYPNPRLLQAVSSRTVVHMTAYRMHRQLASQKLCTACRGMEIYGNLWTFARQTCYYTARHCDGGCVCNRIIA